MQIKKTMENSAIYLIMCLSHNCFIFMDNSIGTGNNYRSFCGKENPHSCVDIIIEICEVIQPCESLIRKVICSCFFSLSLHLIKSN